MAVQIIAEAGSNHNGRIDYAFKLVDIAKEAGADIVKFQIINPDELYVPYYWEKDNKVINEVYQRRMTEKLDYDDWRKIYHYCKEKGILFTASAFDKEGVDFLYNLKVPFIKLASSDLNNIELIRYIAKKGMSTILSTGMATLNEIEISVNEFTKYCDPKLLRVMHCVSSYPCDLSNAGLNKIDELKKNIPCEIGYSDHTQSSIAACIAIEKGVTFLEKHFTLDKSLDGFDHKYASDLDEFKSYCKDVRDVEMDLNNDQFIQRGEEITAIRARRSVYLNKEIQKGETINESDLVLLRPAGKLSPSDKFRMIGLKAGEDLRAYEPLQLSQEFVLRDNNPTWKKANDFWSNEMKEKNMK
ncbi:N-acetylneuraminate synthase family protein [Salegentibacter mishustinae]|uniref:N-acetylneuraminate synthase family protein n=1 Tax=Salegentibacter mishustinae TaxID=270918 RepID=UPI001CE06822|nr:N-acetylneuraminate synthase family protein [Salegentibacter mishustinae]UBZ06866.1 N-acetylneuraminate synthase family protein [Salegentibacter mishustinae]